MLSSYSSASWALTSLLGPEATVASARSDHSCVTAARMATLAEAAPNWLRALFCGLRARFRRPSLACCLHLSPWELATCPLKSPPRHPEAESGRRASRARPTRPCAHECCSRPDGQRQALQWDDHHLQHLYAQVQLRGTPQPARHRRTVWHITADGRHIMQYASRYSYVRIRREKSS